MTGTAIFLPCTSKQCGRECDPPCMVTHLICWQVRSEHTAGSEADTVPADRSLPSAWYSHGISASSSVTKLSSPYSMDELQKLLSLPQII